MVIPCSLRIAASDFTELQKQTKSPSSKVTLNRGLSILGEMTKGDIIVFLVLLLYKKKKFVPGRYDFRVIAKQNINFIAITP
jgi:hypothetical protein